MLPGQFYVWGSLENFTFILVTSRIQNSPLNRENVTYQHHLCWFLRR